MISLLKRTGIALGVVLIVLLLIGGPLMTIWSLNTLFGLAIPFTWQTWLATIWFGLFIATRR